MNVKPHLQGLILITALLIGVASQALAGGNQRVKSFSKAKRLAAQIYQEAGQERTFYCNCSYRRKQVQAKKCGFRFRKNSKRASRIEWEHVVPAHAFGRSLDSWKNGHPACRSSKGKPYRGRRCATKVSKQYRLMQADLYNLVPVIGEVNGDRSNYPMSIIPGEVRRYGTCDIEIQKQQVEPRPAIRGDIARTYLYMNQAYPGLGIINQQNRKLFQAWDRTDPVDQWECRRADLIRVIQENRNPVMEERCRLH